MTAEPDLLPCPFCGGTEIYTVPMEHPSVGEYWMVGCNNSDCPMDTDRVKIEGGTLEKAAAVWNTRATDANLAQLQAENERLRAEVDESDAVVDKLARLLAETAIVIKGPEPDMTKWSYHDIPDGVRAIQARAERLAEVCERLAQKWERQADEHGVRQFTGNDHRLFANELRAALAQEDHNG